MNTKIHYEYRDGANYKKAGSWTITGMCSQDQAQALKKACFSEDDHHFFVPSAVGMADLHEEEWDDEIDHAFCHITEIEMTNLPANDSRTIYDLVNEFQSKNWQNEACVLVERKGYAWN